MSNRFYAIWVVLSDGREGWYTDSTPPICQIDSPFTSRPIGPMLSRFYNIENIEEYFAVFENIKSFEIKPVRLIKEH